MICRHSAWVGCSGIPHGMVGVRILWSGGIDEGSRGREPYGVLVGAMASDGILQRPAWIGNVSALLVLGARWSQRSRPGGAFG